MWPRLLESVGIALANLRENTLQTLLSTLGIIIGVASLIAVLAIGDGMERTAREEVERTTGVQVVILTPRVTEEIEGVTVARHDYPVFTPADAVDAARFAALDGVAVVSAEPQRVVLALTGRVGPVLRVAADLDPADITARPADLDELFLTYYRSPEEDVRVR